jgi:1-hydroxy-2-naphthoate dioxygenase
MFFGMSALNPGEAAQAHRHSIAAIRFVIEGGAHLVTVVDGVVCPMEEHDLIITPGMVWHDHANAEQKHGIWLDVLDFPLVHRLGAFYMEGYGLASQPRNDSPSAPRYRYPYGAALSALRELAREAPSPFDGALYEYPGQDGGSTLPTLSCRLQLLHPGQETRAHRHTSSAVYTVVQGQGALVTDTEETEFFRNDSFVLPNWREHRFVNRSDADDLILFSVTDEPVFRSLGLYREEAAGEASPRPNSPEPW